MNKKSTREVITKRGNMQGTRNKFIKGLSLLLIVALLGSNAAPSVVTAKTTEGTTIIAKEESVQDDANSQGDRNIDEDTVKEKFGEKIDFLKMSKKATIVTENKVMLVDMTASKVLGGSYLSSRSYFSEFTDLMFILTTLREASLTDIVTISKRAASLQDENIYGFEEGDKISLYDLLLCFYFTGSEDARLAIVDHMTDKDTTFIAKMNSVARSIGVINTNYSNLNGDYKKNQNTMLYDIYSIMYELLNEDFVKEVLSENKLFITYQNSAGKTVRKACVNQNMIDAKSVTVPENMKLITVFSRNCKVLGNGQIALAEGENGHYYLSILMEVDERRDIGKESGRILEVVNGTEYFDEEILITPTPIPTVTPTPTKKPEPTVAPKPTVTPTPTPIAYKAKIPTESNNARYQFLMNTNYKAYTIYDAPAGYRSATEASKNMTVITVPVWKMNSAGKKYSSTMKLSIHKKLADGVSSIFKEVYALPMKFPIKTLLGYSYRKVGGVGLSNSTLLSIHSFGAAIDINPGDYDNDYFLGKGNDLRDKSNPYCIPDEVIDIFASYGWFWGGDFEISADTMHFQYLGLEFLSYQGKSPFRELKYKNGTLMSGNDVKNLQQRLNRLGYKVTVDGKYAKSTETAIKKFQKNNKLKVTGVVDYSTWEILINLTHYMGYVF